MDKYPKQFVEFVRQSDSELVWLTVCTSELEPYIEQIFIKAQKSEKALSFSIEQENMAAKKQSFAPLRKAAGKAWLFNLVIAIKISASSEKDFFNLCFQLKNLGFCRIVNLVPDNQEILRAWCTELNLYFSQFDLS